MICSFIFVSRDRVLLCSPGSLGSCGSLPHAGIIVTTPCNPYLHIVIRNVQFFGFILAIPQRKTLKWGWIDGVGGPSVCVLLLLVNE